MENATEALYMAFAVLVFVVALTLSMTMFSQAKETADSILYSRDKNSFLEYDTSRQDKYRIVGLETVIPTLYRYYKENYTVVFKDARNNSNYIKDLNNAKPLTMYTTSKSDTGIWAKDGNTLIYSGTYYGAADDISISSFDLNEEIARNEPWTGDTQNIKNNIDAYITGGSFTIPDGSGTTIDYAKIFSNKSFIENFSKAKFLEKMGEYSYSAGASSGNQQTSITIDGETFSLLRQNKRRVIVYVLLSL